MKKICIDVRMVDSSGVGTYIKNVTRKILNEFKDYSFLIIGDRKKISYFFNENENVKIIDVDIPIYSIKEQLIPKLLPKDIDLIWIPHINIPILYSGKMIVTIHDVFHLAHYNQLSLSQKIYTKGISYYLKKKTTKTLTVSNFSKQEIIKYMGVKDQKIIVTPNGVDERWRDIEASKLNSEGVPYFIYIGNIKPHKNLKNLIIAFSSIKEKIPHDLIIIGKKEGFITGDEEVVKMTDSMNGRVKFTGFVEDEELHQYVKQADALVFPSFYEGFGLPPLEAMACGTPVIASNAASIPEVCGDAALYFDPYKPDDIAEKILTFISDIRLQNDLREKGLKRSELFSWEKCAELTIKVIEEVLAE